MQGFLIIQLRTTLVYVRGVGWFCRDHVGLGTIRSGKIRIEG